jgi:hypothetical protein
MLVVVRAIPPMLRMITMRSLRADADTGRENPDHGDPAKATARSGFVLCTLPGSARFEDLITAVGSLFPSSGLGLQILDGPGGI